MHSSYTPKPTESHQTVRNTESDQRWGWLGLPCESIGYLHRRLELVSELVSTFRMHVNSQIINSKSIGRGDKYQTHGKEECKSYLELLMGRIYAKHATSYSWGGTYATCVLHKSFILNLYTIFMGRIHAKVKKSRYLLIFF